MQKHGDKNTLNPQDFAECSAQPQQRFATFSA
jgi:hypothetical protein